MRVSLFGVLLLGACFHTTVQAGDVDAFIKTEMERHAIPGLALAIVQEGLPVKTSAYGVANLELQVPVRAETVFEIGSITKQFTSACILLLEQEGKLSLDDRITQHLPDAPPTWSNITVRHLLTHTSGLKTYTGQKGFELTRRLTQKRFVEALAKLSPDFAPGEQAKYCNSGYNLLGYIVENVSGQSYWNFLAARIWGPLGVNTATNRHPEILVPNRASGYERRKGAFYNRDGDLTDVFAAGAIVATVGDLVKWNAALDAGKLLNAASRERMWTPMKLNNGETTAYGLGWRIGEFQGRRNIGHSGSTSGFSASFQRFPEEKLAVIVLCNSDEPNIATTLARSVAALHFKETP